MCGWPLSCPPTSFWFAAFFALNEFQQINSFDSNGIANSVVFLWWTHTHPNTQRHTCAHWARTVRICHRMCLWLFYYYARSMAGKKIAVCWAAYVGIQHQFPLKFIHFTSDIQLTLSAIVKIVVFNENTGYHIKKMVSNFIFAYKVSYANPPERREKHFNAVDACHKLAIFIMILLRQMAIKECECVRIFSFIHIYLHRFRLKFQVCVRVYAVKSYGHIILTAY